MLKTVKRILLMAGDHRYKVTAGIGISLLYSIFSAMDLFAILYIAFSINELTMQKIWVSSSILLVGLIGKIICKYQISKRISGSSYDVFSLLNKNVDEQSITDILMRLDLLDYKEKHPMTLSGGQKQRLALAVATLANKDIVIFDEPTSGLDYGNMLKVSELIRELSIGKIVFVATHDRELVELLCNRQIEISDGAVSVYDLVSSH